MITRVLTVCSLSREFFWWSDGTEKNAGGSDVGQEGATVRWG